MSEMSERLSKDMARRMALRMCEANGKLSISEAMELARLCLEEMKTPTIGMLDKALEFDWGPGNGDGTDATPEGVWTAMIDAALTSSIAEPA